EGIFQRMTALMAQGPDLSDDDVIRLRYLAGFSHLNLSRLQLGDASLSAIPEDVTNLELVDVPISDEGIKHLCRLSNLAKLNLAGTLITDAGLDLLAILSNLEWLNVERTAVTDERVSRLKASLPAIQVVR